MIFRLAGIALVLVIIAFMIKMVTSSSGMIDAAMTEDQRQALESAGIDPQDKAQMEGRVQQQIKALQEYQNQPLPVE